MEHTLVVRAGYLILALAVCSGCACGGTERAAPQPPPASPPATPDPCDGVRTERIQVPRGESVTTSTGLTVTLVGIGHDEFEGGGFDLVAHLRYAWGAERDERLPSLRTIPEPRSDRVLGQCVRIVEAGTAGLVMEIGAP